jgi:hypothetical protein
MTKYEQVKTTLEDPSLGFTQDDIDQFLTEHRLCSEQSINQRVHLLRCLLQK